MIYKAPTSIKKHFHCLTYLQATSIHQYSEKAHLAVKLSSKRQQMT